MALPPIKSQLKALARTQPAPAKTQSTPSTGPASAFEALAATPITASLPEQPAVAPLAARPELLRQVLTQGAEAVVETPPSEDPANADVTADFTPDQRQTYDALSPAEREAFNQQYRDGDAPTRAAMEHTLEQGLTSEFLSEAPAVRARYVELFSSSLGRADWEEQLDGLLADGELDDFVELEQATDAGGQAPLRTLLFDGTLRAEDAAGKSSLDYLVAYAREEPKETTPTGIDRSKHLAQILLDLVMDQSIETETTNDCGGVQGMWDLIGKSPVAFVRTQVELAQNGQVQIGEGEDAKILTYTGEPPPPVNSDGSVDYTQHIYNEAFVRGVDVTTRGGSRFARAAAHLDARDGLTAAETVELLNNNALAAGEDRAPLRAITIAQGEEVVPDGQEPGEGQVTESEAARQKAYAKQAVEQQLQAGEPVLIEVVGEDGQEHWVTVIMRDGEYVVLDGLGQQTMNAEQLDAYMDRASAVIYDPEISPDLPDDLYNPALDDTGGQGRDLSADPDEGAAPRVQNPR